MLPEKRAQNMSEAGETSNGDMGKRSYQTPQLRIYGDIREVTQGTGHNSSRDSPSNPVAHKSLP